MRPNISLSISSLSFCIFASSTLAQAPNPAPAPAPQQDFSTVQIKVHQVAGNVHYLEGQGGNVGVLVGDDGVLVIDDQFAPLTDKLVAAIKTLSTKPLRLLVNTHVHGDHTGGNENFGKLGVNIMAHNNVRVRLAQGGNGVTQAPSVALPLVTFGDKVSLHLNGEDIEVGKLPNAHTDGDIFIRFVKADVIHVGDVFRTVGYPGVDGAVGGSVKGTIDALQMIVDMAGPNTKIIPGHGVVATRAEVAAFRQNTIAALERVSALIRQGLTVEQVIAANPAGDLGAKFATSAPPPNPAATQRFYQQFYSALKSEL